MIEKKSQHPTMEYNSAVEQLQETEYPMLQGRTYLDHGGTTIYAKSLIDNYAANLAANLYGNPHSDSSPAKLSSDMVEETREKTLRFFGADPEHFDLIFVANATAAIKMVMDSFKDLASQESGSGFWYGYHIDSHTSAIGVRRCSDTNNHLFATDDSVDAWLANPGATSTGGNPTGKVGLFAYPGQSNMTGRRLPLRWAAQIRASTHPALTDTYSLLDAAALATTTSLHKVFADPTAAPDFTSLSFYKIFGFPDLGGLIVRKASGKILTCRRYFGGGTVTLVTVHGDQPLYESREDLHGALEDGTLPFHNILALKLGIEAHERLYGADCMGVISRHTTFLGKQLYDAMLKLRHDNGAPVVRIYTGVSGSSTYGDPTTQGATLSFNVLRDDGSVVPYTSAVERAANKNDIYVRSGQLCNPGGVGMHLGLEKWHFQRLWAYGHRCGAGEVSGTEIFHGRATGVVRVSMGAMTTAANLDTFLNFLRDEFVVDTRMRARAEAEAEAFENAGLTLEQGIALVIRDKEDESFSEMSEKVGSSELRSDEVRSDEVRSDDDDAVSQATAAEQPKNDLRAYEIVPRSYSSSTTNLPRTEPIMTGAFNEKVHVISVQEFEMSRSKIVIRPSTAKSLGNKEEGHGLKKLLSVRSRSKKLDNVI